MFYIKKHISRNGISDCEVVAEVDTYMDAIHYMNNLGGDRISTDETHIDGLLFYISKNKE